MCLHIILPLQVYSYILIGNQTKTAPLLSPSLLQKVLIEVINLLISPYFNDHPNLFLHAGNRRDTYSPPSYKGICVRVCRVLFVLCFDRLNSPLFLPTDCKEMKSPSTGIFVPHCSCHRFKLLGHYCSTSSLA